ncbi:MAG: NRDE family protein [Candidatus Binatia bacterium]
MCTLAVYRGVSLRWPLVVVANRDEFLGRASAPPERWPGEEAGIVAGRDLVAGGTWLGCRLDGSGRIVGVLNRRPAMDRPASGPGERSRGLLCMESLQAPSIGAALEGLDGDEPARYGGFNLFLADLREGLVVDNGRGLRRVPLDTGLSVLTNLDVNDPRCPRLAGATRRFEAQRSMLAAGADVGDLVPALAGVLSSHDDGSLARTETASGATILPAEAGAVPFSRICVHVGDYGTRSSSMIFVAADGSVRYFHADGAPCSAPFREVEIRPS